MNLGEILNLAIVGGLLSWFLEYITENLDATQSKIATILGAFIVGSLYWFLSTSYLAYLDIVIGVLVSASTVYAFILKK